jgi:hypothetical protein
MAKVTITHEFDRISEQEDLNDFMNAQKAQRILYEIDQDIRAKLKYSEEPWTEDISVVRYLESIRDLIGTSGVLDE